MDKSVNRKKNLLTPEKAASFIPFFISSFISIFVIAFFVMPQYFKSNKVRLELNGLIKKKNELDNLKSQYKIINEKFDKLNNEKLKLKELITGTSQLNTLLAKLGEIGKENSIEFTDITPKKLIKAESKNNKKLKNKRKNKNVVNSKVDPLLVEGIKKYEFDLSFKTDFVNLLAFLRDLEFQDNIILIDDINVRNINRTSLNKEIENPGEMLEVEISIVFYGNT